MDADWLRRPSFPLLLLPLLSGTAAAAVAAGRAVSRALPGGSHWSLLCRDRGRWFHYDSLPGDEHARRATLVAETLDVGMGGAVGATAITRVPIPLQTAAECGCYMLAIALDLARGVVRPGKVGAWANPRTYLQGFITLVRPTAAAAKDPHPGPPRFTESRPAWEADLAMVRALRRALARYASATFVDEARARGPGRVVWPVVGAALRDVLTNEEVNGWPEALAKAGVPRQGDLLDTWLSTFVDRPGDHWTSWVAELEPDARLAMVQSMLKAWSLYGDVLMNTWSKLLLAEAVGMADFTPWYQQQATGLLHLSDLLGMTSADQDSSVIARTWLCCRCGKRALGYLCARTECVVGR